MMRPSMLFLPMVAVSLAGCGNHDRKDPEPPCSIDVLLTGAIEFEHKASDFSCYTSPWSQGPGLVAAWAMPEDNPTVSVNVIVEDVDPLAEPGDYQGLVKIQYLNPDTVRAWSATCTMHVRENKLESDDPDGLVRVSGSADCADAVSTNGVDGPIQVQRISYSFHTLQ